MTSSPVFRGVINHIMGENNVCQILITANYVCTLKTAVILDNCIWQVPLHKYCFQITGFIVCAPHVVPMTTVYFCGCSYV